MYRAKERGPSNVELFDRALRDRVLDRLRLESALRRAVERDELHLAYQPIVALGDGSVSRVEALLRWEHPELGPVSPVEFIPLAEETGLIVALGRWVLEQACREAASWPLAGPGGGRVAVSVNVSPRQLSQPDFPAVVAGVLRDTGLPASALALEITEGILLEQTDRPLDALAELKQLGVGLILDDFGTGYSSLGYLKRLPIDTVKLDRSFIADLASRKAASSVAIVSAVVRMAHALELSVVGEGVETPEQAGELSKLGCAMAQGYYFARPIGAADLRALLGRPLPQS
jgi:EAL domain-containing protein (putative c-di-GMP-specific phosphodiesterase class I)